MVRASQRTLFMCDIELHRQLGKPYTPLVNTTLNEKFTIKINSDLPPGRFPQLLGFVIGLGGTQVIEGYSSYVYNEHSPIDGALFDHIPFIMRPIHMDLTLEERSNYRLRVVETVNGMQYACYYMKLIPSYEIKPNFYTIKTIKDGTSVSTPSLSVFDTNVGSILSPTPRTRSISYKTSTTCEYITKLARVEFILSEEEQAEIKNCIAIKAKENAVITELGLCTGIDVEEEGESEVLACQIAYHIPVNFTMAQELVEGGGTIQKGIELGGLEPLIY